MNPPKPSHPSLTHCLAHLLCNLSYDQVCAVICVSHPLPTDTHSLRSQRWEVSGKDGSATMPSSVTTRCSSMTLWTTRCHLAPPMCLIYGTCNTFTNINSTETALPTHKHLHPSFCGTGMRTSQCPQWPKKMWSMQTPSLFLSSSRCVQICTICVHKHSSRY